MANSTTPKTFLTRVERAKKKSRGRSKVSKGAKQLNFVSSFNIAQQPHTTTHIVRLSDPEVSTTVEATIRTLTTPSDALAFMQKIGVATPTGKLVKRLR
jgi:hypothetical protein